MYHRFVLKKINNKKVSNIPSLEDKSKKKYKGEKLFSVSYPNIFLLGRKKSGKTTVIFNILKNCIDKDTIIYIFSSTYNKDAGWISIMKYFKKLGNHIEAFHNISENKKSNLEPILEMLNEESLEEEEKEMGKESIDINYIAIDSLDEEEKPRKRKKRKLAPEIVFIFDDQGTALRNQEVGDLMKKNRHYKSMVITSSQYLHDITPQSIRQLDYLLAFKGLQDDKLIKIHKGMDLPMDLNQLKSLYKHATSKPYCFLYISANTKDGYRMCFNKKFFIK